MERYNKIPQMVAKDMDVKHSTLLGVLKGNPTVKTLENVAKAIGCPVWEFFRDEIEAAGLTIVPSGQKPAPKQGADDLPFGGEQNQQKSEKAEEARVLRFSYDCPHCGHEVKITIE